MFSNKAQLNKDKTELLIIRGTPQLKKAHSNKIIHAKPSMRNLGLIFDEPLTINDHIS